MIKVVHISTTIKGGGAGIAAFRLHCSLMNDAQIDSHLLERFQEEPEFARKHNIQTPTTSRNIVTRIRKRLNIHIEHYNWLKLNKYETSYEIATIPTTSYRLDQHPMVKGADIIHLHWIGEFIDYPSFFKNIKQPIVWTLHDTNPFCGMFHFELDRLKNSSTFGEINDEVMALKQKSVKKNKNITVVCLSEWMKKQSENSITLGQYPHVIISNGLNFSQYPQLDKDSLAKELKLNNGKKTILVVGAYLENEHKGFPMLFEALRHLDRTDYNLITIGQLSQTLLINDSIHHIHQNNVADVAQLNQYYAVADITIIPSQEDNLPNVMLESFANGTPIISFPNGGMAEHTLNGKNGIIADNISSKDLLQVINDYLDNKYTFDREAIRAYAIKTFSDHIQVERYINLYKQILHK